MGPPRERGGTKLELGRQLMALMLQWGHRANAVERFSPSSGSCLARGFNGATARTRWNVGRLRHDLELVRIGFNGATARTRWNVEVRSDCDCCIRRFNGATARTRWNVNSLYGKSAQSVGFNGATARTRWNGRRRRWKPPRASPASMGPPRERGGTHVAVLAVYVNPERFNGATARTRWNGPPLPVGIRLGTASMGPPRERGGTRLLLREHI